MVADRQKEQKPKNIALSGELRDKKWQSDFVWTIREAHRGCSRKKDWLRYGNKEDRPKRRSFFY